MAADVVIKCRATQPVHNMYATVYVDKMGNMQNIPPLAQEDTFYVSGFSEKLNDRFDDRTYYST